MFLPPAVTRRYTPTHSSVTVVQTTPSEPAVHSPCPERSSQSEPQTTPSAAEPQQALSAAPAAAPLITPAVERILMVALILTAAGLRLGGLDRESLWVDEYRQVSTYALPFGKMVDSSFRLQRQTPLDYAIGWAIFRIHPSDFAMRLPAAIFGIAAVPMLYLLSRRLFSPQVALVAAAALAVSPLHLEYSQEARPYAIFVFFYLTMLYTLSRALECNRWRNWLLFLLAAMLMLLARAFGPVIVLATTCLTAMLIYSRQLYRSLRLRSLLQQPAARLACCAVLLGVFYAPVFAYMFRYEQRRAFSALLGTPPNRSGAPIGLALDLLTRNADVLATTAQQSLEGWWPIKVTAIAIGLAWLILRLARQTHSQRTVCLAMVLAGPAYLLAYSAFVGIEAAERYFLFIGPLCCLLLAVGLIEAAPRLARLASRGSTLNRLWIVACLALVLVTGGRTCLWLLQRHSKPDWRGCAEFLEDRLHPDDAVFVFVDRRFGREHRSFQADRYLTRPPAFNGAMWNTIRSEKTFEQAMAVPNTGRAYLVLYYMSRGFARDEEFRRFGLKDVPEGVEVHNFRRLDLLWFDKPSGNVWQQIYEFATLLLNGDIGRALAPDNRAHVVLLLFRARLLVEYGQTERAVSEYHQAEQLCPPDQQDYFIYHTQGLRELLDVTPAWQDLQTDTP